MESSRQNRFLGVLALLLAIGASAVVWWQSERAYNDSQRLALHDIGLRAEQLADAMAGQIGSLLGTIDLELQHLRRSWPNNPQHTAEIADALLANLPPDLAAYVSIVDAEGRIVFTSLPDLPTIFVGDRPHFRVHLDGQDRLHIGSPVESRLAGGWAFIINRPILDGARFAGTVNLAVRTEGLSKFVSRLQLHEQDMISVLQRDGSFLARSVDNALAMGRAVPKEGRPFLQPEPAPGGHIRQPGGLDQIPRSFGWRLLDPYGLTIVAGLAENNVLEPLQAERDAQRRLIAAVIALLLIAGIALALLFFRESGRQARTARLVQGERERRDLLDQLAALPALADGDVPAVARFVTERAAPFMNTERASVWLFDGDGSVLICEDLYRRTPNTHESGLVLAEAGCEREFAALRETPCIAADDPLNDPRTAGYVKGYLKPLGITAMLDTRISVDNVPCGVLCFEHVGLRHQWSDPETAFAGRLAELLGQALANRRRMRSRMALQAINKAQTGFIAQRPPSEIFNDLLDTLLQLTESEYGFIGEVLHQQNGTPYIKAHGISNIAWNDETRRFFEDSAPQGLNFYSLDNLFGKVVTGREMLIANDAPNDPRRHGTPQGHPPLRRFMGIPFFDGEELRGIIALANRAKPYEALMASWLGPLLTACTNMIGSLKVERQRQEAESALAELNETLEHRIEERIADAEHARREAERANAAKSEFLSRMSHELRTPLNAIIGFGQLLQMPDEPLSEQQADNVDEILKAGRHLLEQVNEVLDLARIESGRIELSVEPVELKPLFDECATLLAPQAATSHIIIASALEPTDVVRGDHTRVRQVLLNLLSNAIKYNRPGGKVSVSARPQGDFLRVEVEDTGYGIAEEKQDRLFRPFERLESAYSNVEGTGIGLALTKRLVEAMQGEIGVQSTPGQGSTFWFTLPRTNPSRNGAAPPMSRGAAASIAPAPKDTRQQLLYVEDNPANLKLVEKLLQRRPEIVLTHAISAESGLSCAFDSPPDLILLDINLPGMDGFSALQQLRGNASTASVPVIALTANAMVRDVRRGEAAGFAAYLTKPLDIELFYATLDTHLPSSIQELP